jgi:hypothetical protein
MAPSDPLVDGLRADPKDMDQGLDGDRTGRSTVVLGLVPRRCDDRTQVWWRRGDSNS